MATGHIPHKLEIDVLQVSDVEEAAQLSYKYGFPAMIVHGSIINDALVARGKIKGKYKIITPIDWPKGEKSGSLKFRDAVAEIFETDGFEIMLSDEITGHINAEVTQIVNFIRTNLGEHIDIRFVLGAYTRPNYADICAGLKNCRLPNFLRLDIPTKGQVTKCNSDTHNQIISDIDKILSIPIKAAGNINNTTTIKNVNASRFAVNLVQARSIIKEMS